MYWVLLSSPLSASQVLSFAKLFFVYDGLVDVNGSTVFEIFLNHLVQGTKPMKRHKDMQCLSSSLLRQFDKLTGYSVDMLKLMLEVIPESMQGRVIRSGDDQSGSEESGASFQSYLSDINTRLASAFALVHPVQSSEPVGSFNAAHNQQALDRVVDKENELFVQTSELYSQSKAGWAALENAINSKYFLNCLRLD